MVKVNEDNFEKEVANSEIPVLVDIWASWCAPCKLMEGPLKETEEEYEGKLKVAKLEVDGNEDLVGGFEISGVPTLLLFKEGKVVNTNTGILSKEGIEDFVKEVL